MERCAELLRAVVRVALFHVALFLLGGTLDFLYLLLGFHFLIIVVIVFLGVLLAEYDLAGVDLKGRESRRWKAAMCVCVFFFFLKGTGCPYKDK